MWCAQDTLFMLLSSSGSLLLLPVLVCSCSFLLYVAPVLSTDSCSRYQIGLDADEEIVYRAQHRAASAGLIERCVFVKGELSRLAREEPFSFLDVKRALKRFVSGGFAEYSDVVMRMLEQEAQGLTPATAQHTSCKTLILHHILLEQRIRDESRPLSPADPHQKTKSFNGDFDLVVVVDAGSAASILESRDHLEVVVMLSTVK